VTGERAVELAEERFGHSLAADLRHRRESMRLCA
jgi:hypothetical protein